MEIPPELRAVVESGPLVHLTTLNADGSPQVTVVWAGFDGGDLVTAHLPDAAFPAPRGPGFVVRYAVEKISGVGPWA